MEKKKNPNTVAVISRCRNRSLGNRCESVPEGKYDRAKRYESIQFGQHRGQKRGTLGWEKGDASRTNGKYFKAHWDPSRFGKRLLQKKKSVWLYEEKSS